MAIVLLLTLALGVVQVSLVLYARNVVISASHEAARALVELGRDPDEGHQIALTTVRNASGGLLGDPRVQIDAITSGDRYVIRVRVAGMIQTFGPVPITVPVSVSATAMREDFRGSRR